MLGKSKWSFLFANIVLHIYVCGIWVSHDYIPTLYIIYSDKKEEEKKNDLLTVLKEICCTMNIPSKLFWNIIFNSRWAYFTSYEHRVWYEF